VDSIPAAMQVEATLAETKQAETVVSDRPDAPTAPTDHRRTAAA
jgi:hypothetical protein